MDHNAKFDLIVLSEVLEHVDHIDRVLEHAAALLADDGRVVISTINSTLRARVETIWVAEHLLNLVPVGTHDFAKYQSPEGIQAKLHKVGLEPVQVQGMVLSKPALLLWGVWDWHYSTDTSVNWIACYQKRLR